MSKTKETLFRVVKEQLDVVVTEQHITDKTKFKDLGVDSLDTIEALITLEDELGIELNDQRLENLENISELVQYLSEFD
ncbi:MAG: hypothetical protein CBB97_01755 [Candidatus Endolissoclinum sp. TMED37]|jgi:acyl carrier protein|nr:MAG: hypothetical protein CBB97_01755 [Candidatus Endolissoclinum sp. TMED37]|tara:strand:- start:92 stop:328 length:237 start_codon:yes stop_codon:yes gene_type:complete